MEEINIAKTYQFIVPTDTLNYFQISLKYNECHKSFLINL